MTKVLALGFVGLVLAVAVGFGIHALTRETIALPVIRLEQGASLAPPAARTPQAPSATTGAATTTGSAGDRADEDGSGSGSSGSGRGRGRGRGGDDDD